MLGTLILHGLELGVLLMQTEGSLVYAILTAILVATIMMFFIGWGASGVFIAVLR